MFRFLTLTVAMSFIVSCAMRNPTPFRAKGPDGYGSQIITDKENPRLQIALFEGNSDTRASAALAFSFLTASQHCHDQNLIPIVTTPHDYSKQSTYTSVSSSSYRVGGQNYTNFYSVPVTHNYPKFATAFMCVKKVRGMIGLDKTTDLSREMVHPYMQDFKGGIFVEKVKSDVETSFKDGDVIVTVNGKRVEKATETNAILEEVEGQKVKVKVVREKKISQITANIKDTSLDVAKSTNETVKVVCGFLEKSESPAYCQPYTGVVPEGAGTAQTEQPSKYTGPNSNF